MSAGSSASVKVASYRVACKCGASTVAPAPLGRRTPDGFAIIMRDHHRGWACPACQVQKCLHDDCTNARSFSAADYVARQTSDGWMLRIRSGKHRWQCPTCAATKKAPRGFGAPGYDRERQREIARNGGRAAHAKGTAHEWTPEQARAAGRKGGIASHGGRGKNFQRDQQQLSRTA